MGCCLLALVMIGAPRIALFFWWITNPGRFALTFQGWLLFPGLWPILGFFILPWTTLAYVFVAPNGLSPLDWVILAIALLIDLGSHGGGGAVYRRRRSNS
ncbi:MAG: hypothetical protein P4L93_06145 [Coriobacteriia bacterium]|nr:hypothetical protein [Coriobacteriia bacterium]